MNNARNKILEKIQKAKVAGATQGIEINLTPEEAAASVFVPPQGNLVENFKSELEKISGNCLIVGSNIEAQQVIKEFLLQESIDSLLCLDSDLEKTLSTLPLINDASLIATTKATLTGCEYLISRTGSVMVSNANDSGRRMHVAPDVHVVLGNASQVVSDLTDALQLIAEKYKNNLPSWISNITGPSRTADIEKTLILGAHGPKKLLVVIVSEKMK